MSLFALIGLALAAVAVLAYIIICTRNKRRPELSDAVIVFLGSGGVVSAVRIIGAVFTGQFSHMTSTTGNTSIWALVPDDAVQIVLGGLALAWVSIQTVLQSFNSIRSASEAVNVNEQVGMTDSRASKRLI